jgi:tripartite ATP-independent transporter DctP family solute receptor
MKRIGSVLCMIVVLTTILWAGGAQAEKAITLRYAHMNAPTSVAGMNATMFADLVKEKTGGRVLVEVYPSSQLGTLQEMAEQVSSGVIALHHNTMAAIGSLYEDFAALDTPFLYRDVDHLLKVTDPESPLMQKLGAELIKRRGVRVLYCFYFGSRELTCDRPIYKPEDLNGVKIRSIPFPIYITAVEGLGAVSTPVDWAEVPTALATGAVNGQENPFHVIYANKLYELQSYLMLTNHIMGAEIVVMNEKKWQDLPADLQEKIAEVAKEMSVKATQMTLDLEAEHLQKLKDAGMTVIGPDEGLDVEAFRERTQKLVQERFGEKYGELYNIIKAIK